MPHISGKVGKLAYETGDWSKGALSVGQAVAFADRREPLADIVKRIVTEAKEALTKTRSLMNG